MTEGGIILRYTLRCSPMFFKEIRYMNKTQGSPLDVVRHKALADYSKKVSEAPPVSRALLDHIESMFVPPDVSPGDPNINEKLLFQHGINRVLKYLRGLHERQEKELQDRYERS